MRREASTVLAGLAVAAALLAAGFLAIGPVYKGEYCEATVPGLPQGANELVGVPLENDCRQVSRSLLEDDGPWVLTVLVIPIALTAAGLVALMTPPVVPRRLAWPIAIAYLALCVVTVFSIGMLFLPSAALLVASAAAGGRRIVLGRT